MASRQETGYNILYRVPEGPDVSWQLMASAQGEPIEFVTRGQSRRSAKRPRTQ